MPGGHYSHAHEPDVASETDVAQAADVARSAETTGDEAVANEAWRRYRRIRDAGRDPEQLLLEGVALSEQARALAALDHHGS